MFGKTLFIYFIIGLIPSLAIGDFSLPPDSNFNYSNQGDNPLTTSFSWTGRGGVTTAVDTTSLWPPYQGELILSEMPENAETVKAFFYVAGWFSDTLNCRASFNGQDFGEIPPTELDGYSGYFSGMFLMYRFDVTGFVSGNGAYPWAHLQDDLYTFAVSLVVVYEQLTSPPMEIIVNDGAEIIKNSNTTTVFSVDSPTDGQLSLYTDASDNVNGPVEQVKINSFDLDGPGDIFNGSLGYCGDLKEYSLSYIFPQTNIRVFTGEDQFGLVWAVLSNNFPPGVGNDCNNVIPISYYPYSDSGNTCLFTDDCDIVGNDIHDVIYEMYVGHAGNYNISLCNSSYDTKLAIYQDECCPGSGLEFAENDNSFQCSDTLNSFVSSFFDVGSYYIVVDGNNDCGEYVLEVIAEETPCCDVDLIPDDDSIQVTPGGSFGFTGSVGNQSADPVLTDVWGGVVFEDTMLEQFSYEGVSLDAGEYNSSHTVQQIPPWATPGTYNYVAYCGDKPDIICDSSSFNFTIIGTRTSSGKQNWSISGDSFIWGNPTEDVGNTLQCHPNPFNSSLSISFSLQKTENIHLTIFNLLGQQITTIAEGLYQEGIHHITWNADNNSTGIYFLRFTAGKSIFTQRISLIK
ncbi:MAG: T9SS type A sorting domain-containing protein [candidate division Zixibacteria bacterium]|nr:T9SS type A sorting domain-containing protein [candidate division Zixibacteria bacterium]